jgi:hypothetical protein
VKVGFSACATAQPEKETVYGGIRGNGKSDT